MSSLAAVARVHGVPEPRGPFSQAVIATGTFVFVSGQGPFDPERGEFIAGDVGEQTRLTLGCIDRILASAGSNRQSVVSCRVYLQNLDRDTFQQMNEAYGKFFGAHRPARTTIGAQLLGIGVEIDCIARIP